MTRGGRNGGQRRRVGTIGVGAKQTRWQSSWRHHGPRTTARRGPSQDLVGRGGGLEGKDKSYEVQGTHGG